MQTGLQWRRYAGSAAGSWFASQVSVLTSRHQEKNRDHIAGTESHRQSSWLLQFFRESYGFRLQWFGRDARSIASGVGNAPN
jgi:hypothetical protein